MSYISVTPYPGYDNLLYIIGADGTVGWCANTNLSNVPADIASTVNTQPLPTAFNATGLSDNPPLANVGETIVQTGASGSTGVPTTDEGRKVSGTVAGCTFSNPA